MQVIITRDGYRLNFHFIPEFGVSWLTTSGSKEGACEVLPPADEPTDTLNYSFQILLVV